MFYGLYKSNRNQMWPLSLWYQTFILSAEYRENSFVPVCFGLLPDKKRWIIISQIWKLFSNLNFPPGVHMMTSLNLWRRPFSTHLGNWSWVQRVWCLTLKPIFGLDGWTHFQISNWKGVIFTIPRLKSVHIICFYE